MKAAAKSGNWSSLRVAANLVAQPEGVVRRWVDSGLVRVDTIRGRPYVSLDDCLKVGRRCSDPADAVQRRNAPGGQIPEASAMFEPSGDIPTPPDSALRTALVGRDRTRGQF